MKKMQIVNVKNRKFFAVILLSYVCRAAGEDVQDSHTEFLVNLHQNIVKKNLDLSRRGSTPCITFFSGVNDYTVFSFSKENIFFIQNWRDSKISGVIEGPIRGDFQKLFLGEKTLKPNSKNDLEFFKKISGGYQILLTNNKRSVSASTPFACLALKLSDGQREFDGDLSFYRQVAFLCSKLSPHVHDLVVGETALFKLPNQIEPLLDHMRMKAEKSRLEDKGLSTDLGFE